MGNVSLEVGPWPSQAASKPPSSTCPWPYDQASRRVLNRVQSPSRGGGPCCRRISGEFVSGGEGASPKGLSNRQWLRPVHAGSTWVWMKAIPQYTLRHRLRKHWEPTDHAPPPRSRGERTERDLRSEQTDLSPSSAARGRAAVGRLRGPWSLRLAPCRRAARGCGQKAL